MAETIKELRQLPDEELIRRHDERTKHTEVATQHYLDELGRRDAERMGERMEQLTTATEDLTLKIYRLTWLGVGLAFISTVLAVISAVLAFQ